MDSLLSDLMEGRQTNIDLIRHSHGKFYHKYRYFKIECCSRVRRRFSPKVLRLWGPKSENTIVVLKSESRNKVYNLFYQYYTCSY